MQATPVLNIRSHHELPMVELPFAMFSPKRGDELEVQSSDFGLQEPIRDRFGLDNALDVGEPESDATEHAFPGDSPIQSFMSPPTPLSTSLS